MAGGDKLKVLSLFAGIGGFDLGLERTGGFETVAFCEQDKKCQRVLAKHWPGVPCYDDVRTLTAEQLAADGIAPNIICGGFPCQDISTAGLGAGIEGERSGLWTQFARLISELRPLYVIVENVSALLSRGLDRVLGDLAALGYDALWHCIPAAAVGAPHRRDRIWIVAHPGSGGQRPVIGSGEDTGSAGAHKSEGHQRKRLRPVPGRGGQTLAHAEIVQRNGGNNNAGKRVGGKPLPEPRNNGGPAAVADSSCSRLSLARPLANGANGEQGGGVFAASSWWAVEPAVGRVANGVPGRVDRLKQLGNAVVPQIPELIGRAILASLEEQREAA